MKIIFKEFSLPSTELPFQSEDEALVWVWEFEIILSPSDKTEVNSFNTGNAKMSLAHNKARFYFPFTPTTPHPDIFALGIIKMISPFVGERLELPRAVTQKFAEDIKEHYGFNIHPIEPYLPTRDCRGDKDKKYAVSFSGGADSIAAALMMPEGTHLIHHSRCKHPELPEREIWYKPKANVEALRCMPEHFKKTIVYSDFETLCWNGNYHVYPDDYAFTIPLIFLSDHFNISGVVTGDISAAFTEDETKFERDIKIKSSWLFYSVGLDFFAPLSGASEFGSIIINKHFGLHSIATSCAYGEFQKPCKKCIKCFRKTLVDCAIEGRKIPDDFLTSFESSPAVHKYIYGSEQRNISFIPTYKHALSCIPGEPKGILLDLKRKTDLLEIDTSFEYKYYSYASLENLGPIEKKIMSNVLMIIPEMNTTEISIFEKLDVIEFFQEKRHMESLKEIVPHS